MTILNWPGRDALPPVQKWSASTPRQLYRDRRITVEEVQVSTGTGTPFPHQAIRFASDSVAAVVHSRGRGVLMLYRHRFITDRAGLALPAGGIEPGEHPVDAAAREVFEETGCKIQDARLMGSADVLPGVADKRFWFVSGTAAGSDVPEPADAHESTALYWVPVNELFSLMSAGLISAQPSMLALLYAERAGLLRELPHRKKPGMTEHSETWDGGLTVSAGTDGTDTYDFGPRAAAVTSLKSGLRLPEMTPLPSPWTLEIEPTLLCNARCHFCSYEDLIRDHRERQRALPVIQRTPGLAWERVRHLLEEIRSCGTTRGIFWSGGGEPLVWPHLTDAIITSSEFADVSLQTNGIKLDRLLTGPRALGNLSVLSISVYSDLRQQHKQIAGVDSFERVSRNIHDAAAMRDRHDWNLTIGAKILVDRINYRRLPEIIRYYRALGADSVALREVQGANHGEAGQERQIGLREDQRQEICRQASGKNADPALLFFARALTGTHSAIPPTRHCYNATDGHFACVDAEGEVYLGNPEIGDRQYSIGNILTSSWHDTWRSGRHLEIIKLMDTLQRSAQCRLSVCRHVRANIGAEHALTLIKPARPLDSFL